jgi:nitrogen regulatory protein PII
MSGQIRKKIPSIHRKKNVDVVQASLSEGRVRHVCVLTVMGLGPTYGPVWHSLFSASSQI